MSNERYVAVDTYAVLPYVADRRYLIDDGSRHTAGTLLYHIWVRQMNERIKELAEQANLEIDPAHPDHNQKVLEKFAELIVRECADIGQRYADGNYEVPNQILEYFGLEEEEWD